MNDTANYYVYVYIDPRNFEEFYYGKGKGKRKFVHLSGKGSSQKAKRIQEIHKEKLEPIVKVIAANLTEAEAFLIEKTLIWKLGGQLTNVSSGHFAEKFRPHNTFHQELFGFDFHNGIYYVNVGQGIHRAWADCQRYGFLSAGHGKKWSDQIKALQSGDVVVAYLKGKGYVGVGVVQHKAVRVRDFKISGKQFSTMKQKLDCPNVFHDSDDPVKSEYLIAVDWKATTDAEHAKWKSRSHLFTTQLVKASLANQPDTLSFIEQQFRLKLKDLLQ
jgi:uncharacterized protein